MFVNQLRSLYRRFLPVPFRQWVIRHFRFPYSDKTDFGDLYRTKPISRVWGLDRGIPVDRYYIDKFMLLNQDYIHGNVLEIGNNTYTLQYGGDKVRQSDILHVAKGSPNATIIADLTQADHIPSSYFDCIICTQTLHLIFEVELAIQTLHRILKPGGSVLVTLPGISQISRYDMDRWGDYWRFTEASCKLLFAKYFCPENLQLKVFGNVLAATAFLQGIAVHELPEGAIDFYDPDFQLLIGVLATKKEVDS